MTKTNEQILAEFREKFPTLKLLSSIRSTDTEDWFLSNLEAKDREKEEARQTGRDEAVKIVRKSRTTDEVYGIGAAEQTARYQAIVDILAARSLRV